MPAVGRGRPVLTTYLTRVPIGASLTLGRAATAATQLRAFNPWFASVKPPTLCSAGDGTLVGYSRFPSFGAPVRADQVLGTGVLAKREPVLNSRAAHSGGPSLCTSAPTRRATVRRRTRAGRTGPEGAYQQRCIGVEKSDAIVEAECRYKGRAFLRSPRGRSRRTPSLAGSRHRGREVRD